MGAIYKITNPSNKVYVGKTYCPEKRISDYKARRYNSKNSIIMDSVIKYGWDAHRFEVIETVEDELLNEREIFWIKELDTYAYENKTGMNLTRGGDGQRHSWINDIERRKKASLQRKGKTTGVKHSEETKRHIAKGVSEYNIKNNVRPSEDCHLKSVSAISKPVVCYNLNGSFISEFGAIKYAAKELGINRRQANDAALGNQKHCMGFIIKYKTENYPLTLDVSGINFLVRKNKNHPHIGDAQ